MSNKTKNFISSRPFHNLFFATTKKSNLKRIGGITWTNAEGTARGAHNGARQSREARLKECSRNWHASQEMSLLDKTVSCYTLTNTNILLPKLLETLWNYTTMINARFNKLPLRLDWYFKTYKWPPSCISCSQFLGFYFPAFHKSRSFFSKRK